MNAENSTYPDLSDTDFDLRARAELALAFEAGAPPEHLMRKPPSWLRKRRLVHAIMGLVLLSTGAGTVLAMRPPALVRDAIEHESHERNLRGSTMDPQQLLAHLGLGNSKVLPGFPQLMRVCDIEGQVAYHLITYFDNMGMVTVLAFEQPAPLKESNGWWSGVHWRVIHSQEGKPLLLVASKASALNAAQTSLRGRAPG